MYKLKESSRVAAVHKFREYIEKQIDIESNVIEEERHIRATAIMKVLCAQELISGHVLHTDRAQEFHAKIDPVVRDAIGLDISAIQIGINHFILSWLKKGLLEQDKAKITQ